ncbi:MAG: UDP-N-acetylmuramate dehydrogenase [Flavobacteriales bacterium]|nr:UDP-N-acetylmuramate dehydrogenase [Flavobacteriales bacterium]
MNLQENISLKSYNTFGINCKTKYFTECFSIKEITEAVAFSKQNNIPFLVLGGGSNVLFTKDFLGLTIKINSKGIYTEKNDENHILVTAQAGENWNDFVQHCINNEYGGIENLSLIPGNVGTAPIQNIGAYGLEIKDIFYELKALNVETLLEEVFSLKQCKFGYRDSFFKNEGKGKYIILSVTFRLTTKNHNINTSYGDITQILNKQNITKPTLRQVSDAIIHIRESKLPNPKEIGNAGSFFKNPTINTEQFNTLQQKFPDLKGYENANGIKISAAFLIEKANLKGKRFGNCGIHEKQALVLVNYSDATGQEIYELSQHIINIVNKEFNVLLQAEVNVI